MVVPTLRGRYHVHSRVVMNRCVFGQRVKGQVAAMNLTTHNDYEYVDSVCMWNVLCHFQFVAAWASITRLYYHPLQLRSSCSQRASDRT